MKAPDQPDFPKLEADLLKTWANEKTFEQSLANRKNAKRFNFYDGPPFASGEPHYGHVEQSAVKDAVARYQTMRGRYVPRRVGYDTHGLPVEFLVEKDLGLATKADVVKLGIGKFNEACRAIVFKHRADFEQMFTRLGRWADFGQSYATLDDTYMESVWWVFSQLYQKDLIYQDFKSLPYCPRCATPLSNFELNDGYRDDVEDPSVFVTFPLVDDPKTSLLAWTTTPWTLPANAALAVDAKADYVMVERKDGAKLILAKERLSELDLRKTEYKTLKIQKGKELVGLAYKPLYESKVEGEPAQKVWHVYADDSVSLEDGTGVLHVAPRYGETDLALGQRENLPLLESVDAAGLMTVDPWRGQFFKQADPHIVANLTQKGRVFAAETFTHTYPFCWRCETPLMYFATPSWFVKVTAIKDQLLKAGGQTSWVPAHVKTGRFMKWLEGARDWAISRTRFWGTPIPVWQCDNEHRWVAGSVAELKERAINPEVVGDLHRPGIDGVKVKCSECDGEMSRIPEVFDCWFESGSMPYGQDHYPFEHKAEFEAAFPAEFIVEALEQVHLWFYTLHVLAVALMDKPAYTNVVATGLILAADGKKLSKRLRNYPPVEELFSQYGADTVRYFLLSSPLMSAEDVRLDQNAMTDIHRQVFMTLWNVYSFLATYAAAEDWKPDSEFQIPKSDNVLDQWMLARLDQTITEVTKAADKYDIARATRPLRELIDDLSNWYLRRSRRRFKGEDKAEAFATLHYVLVRTCQLMAPWAPFMSDKIWRELAAGTDLSASVHLSDWPQAGTIDDELLVQMAELRQLVVQGLAARAAAGIKVRQPLGKLEIPTNLQPGLLEIMAEEVNVKAVVKGSSLKLDINLTPELKAEGMARDIVRAVQQRRKEEGLQAGDRIELTLVADDALIPAIHAHADMIKTETLASELNLSGDRQGVPVRVGDHDLYIGIAKV